MIHEVNIDNDKFDEFERYADNVGVLHVLDDKSNNVSSEVKVQLYLNKNALLGLGTELIRLAYNFKEGKHYHVEPADKHNLCQRLGIFLTPDSSELIVCCSEQDIIDDYLE